MWEDIQNAWAVIVFIFTSVGAFFVWLRSLLRKRPSIAEFRARGNSLWRAVLAKLTFLKTKLLAGFLMAASAIVGLYDALVPIALGVDWQPLTSKVPAWIWPIVSFAVLALFYWLRTITANETNRMLAAVQDGNTPREAAMMVATAEAPLPNSEQKVT